MIIKDIKKQGLLKAIKNAFYINVHFIGSELALTGNNTKKSSVLQAMTYEPTINILFLLSAEYNLLDSLLFLN
jgi:hypothetical protein